MFFMYARLYFILFRAHRRLISLGASESGNPSGSNSHRLDSHGLSGATVVSASHTRKLKKLARLMLLYPLSYAAIWSLPTGIRIYQTISGLPAPWQLQTLDKACIVLQGLVDAIIYSTTESSLSSWRNIFLPTRFPAVSGVARVVGGSKRWSSARGTGEQQQFASGSPPTGAGTHAAANKSDESLGSPSVDVSAVGSSDRIELRNLNGTAATMDIRKTVDIEITRTAGRGGEERPQKPLQVYFSEASQGSYLNL